MQRSHTEMEHACRVVDGKTGARLNLQEQPAQAPDRVASLGRQVLAKLPLDDVSRSVIKRAQW